MVIVCVDQEDTRTHTYAKLTTSLTLLTPISTSFYPYFRRISALLLKSHLFN